MPVTCPAAILQASQRIGAKAMADTTPVKPPGGWITAALGALLAVAALAVLVRLAAGLV